MKRTPLRRKPGQRSLQPRKRINRVSKTNKRWNAPGRARPDEPMTETCEAAIPGVCSGGLPTDRHHIIPRGPGSTPGRSTPTRQRRSRRHERVHRARTGD